MVIATICERVRESLRGRTIVSAFLSRTRPFDPPHVALETILLLVVRAFASAPV